MKLTERTYYIEALGIIIFAVYILLEYLFNDNIYLFINLSFMTIAVFVMLIDEVRCNFGINMSSYYSIIFMFLFGIVFPVARIIIIIPKGSSTSDIIMYLLTGCIYTVLILLMAYRYKKRLIVKHINQVELNMPINRKTQCYIGKCRFVLWLVVTMLFICLILLFLTFEFPLSIIPVYLYSHFLVAAIIIFSLITVLLLLRIHMTSNVNDCSGPPTSSRPK